MEIWGRGKSFLLSYIPSTFGTKKEDYRIYIYIYTFENQKAFHLLAKKDNSGTHPISSKKDNSVASYKANLF